jgi:asparagine synthase (glutamine-hydrolysing)
VADVDLGALLSGGIDSSTVVALMQQAADRPVKTFSIGFSEKQYNEAEYALAVARHLGTEHHEMYITPGQALDTISSLPQIYDEPFADSSQIPTYLVSQLAREQVTVVLTGDGGDESMAGYRRYLHALKDWRRLQRIPGAAKTMMAGGSSTLADLSWRLSRAGAERGRPASEWARRLAKQGRRADMWRATAPQQLLANRFNNGIAVDQYIEDAATFPGPLTDPANWPAIDDPQLQMLHYDYHGYLSDDILVKVDRASMAVSLEARAPLLDTRVLALAWSLPPDYLLKDKVGKRVLRDVLYRHVPRELIDRPKRGFSVPIKEWLVGPLRDWVEDLISEQALREQGIFRADQVRQAWRQHLCGWSNHSELLWSVLMFQAWWHSQRT